MHFRQISVLLWVGMPPYPPYTFAICALMLCYLIPLVSEWGETTVYHHRACFGVKNRRYTRLRKAFTAWRQASHITQNVPEEFLNFWKEVKDMKYKWYLCIKK